MGSVVLQLSLLIQARETRYDDVINVIFTAVSPQAFGFPMVVCHVNGKPEMFFGSDRFELMAHCIGETLLLRIINKHKSKALKMWHNKDYHDIWHSSSTVALSLNHPDKNLIDIDILSQHTKKYGLFFKFWYWQYYKLYCSFFSPFVSVGCTKFSISLAIPAETALSFLPSLIFVFSVSGEKWLGPQPHSAVKLWEENAAFTHCWFYHIVFHLHFIFMIFTNSSSIIFSMLCLLNRLDNKK